MLMDAAALASGVSCPSKTKDQPNFSDSLWKPVASTKRAGASIYHKRMWAVHPPSMPWKGFSITVVVKVATRGSPLSLHSSNWRRIDL